MQGFVGQYKQKRHARLPPHPARRPPMQYLRIYADGDGESQVAKPSLFFGF